MLFLYLVQALLLFPLAHLLVNITTNEYVVDFYLWLKEGLFFNQLLNIGIAGFLPTSISVWLNI